MNAAAGPPNLLAGRYQLERILGSGGMGVVYRARDLLHEAFGEPDARVALKLLGETLCASTDAHVLLYSEFALTRSLRHEHVVRAFSFEVDTAHQLAFFTMEVMPGLTLDRLLPECPQGMAWQALQPIALQLLDALAYTHRQGVLHGDVKPANIMVGEQGIRLFDFGLGHAEAQARAGLPGLSRSRLNAWTPAYAAPELMAGGLPSPRADLYGVASVLYELAEGRRPGERQQHQPLPRPRQLPRHCWPAVSSALAMDPEQRTVSVAELREVLGCGRRVWFLG
ncbi:MULTISPECIES: serine/threonine-protein kinase [Pseudomonas]|jgi:serine/threonine-protein kinase Stk1|uniref:Serine/threonine protein kinase n=1 Tax=Pseudomonas extremorientalis TaxID=169669 RepID=A0A1H0K5W9_9PSED|nr:MULTISPECIES: serine/threonine-protein kinase [Pseudomonas]KAB0519547.1 serine/threonine protein kinase [Pseudomonas extremorientalis]OIN13678.1 serine/threonine protein kinase [Pseudomonas extremorientalis]QZP23807.1 serine/threonine protein kinase [Pseudomonas sp. DR208]UUN86328.1 serine/threonine protein kinase [Pseudomonas extremorientalis]WLG54249.1 serine/threonine-protein kinase [Pseudomonas extremorientalis]